MSQGLGPEKASQLGPAPEGPGSSLFVRAFLWQLGAYSPDRPTVLYRRSATHTFSLFETFECDRMPVLDLEGAVAGRLRASSKRK